MDKRIIVERIEELMKENGISRYALKENADISSTVYQWRKNVTRDADRIPSLRSVEKVCDFLGVSLSYFFAMDGSERLSVKASEVSNMLNDLSVEELDLIIHLVKVLKSPNKLV